MRSEWYKKFLKEIAQIMSEYDINHCSKYSAYSLGMIRSTMFSALLNNDISRDEFDILQERITNAYNRID